jgi:hypothetical protein
MNAFENLTDPPPAARPARSPQAGPAIVYVRGSAWTPLFVVAAFVHILTCGIVAITMLELLSALARRSG